MMKLNNIAKTLILSSVLYISALIHADQEYAKVIFDVPGTELKVCAHYIIQEGGFNIALYEADANNIKNNRYVGYTGCMTNKSINFAYAAILYIIPEVRQKNYGRLIMSLAFQEFANQGFKKVSLLPQQVDSVKTQTLRDIYSSSGATATFNNMMEYDISSLQPLPAEPFENILPDLLYYKKYLEAAREDDLLTLIKTLADGVNPNAQEEFTGMTALMYAAEAGNDEIVNYLISQPSVNVDMQDAFGGSVITHMIAKHANVEVIRSILKLRHFVPQITKTAAEYARKAGRNDLAKTLEAASKKTKPVKSKL